MKKGVLIFWLIIIVLIVAGLGAAFLIKPVSNADLDSFAQCLKDKGTTFYGAFWCPHCQRTKAMFGASVKYVPYVECSTPDGQGQTQICKDAKIESYPTWERQDGQRITGEQSLKALSEFSGCPLSAGTNPDDNVTTTE